MVDIYDLKKSFTLVKTFLIRKKTQNIIAIVLLLVVLFLGVQIRTQNLPNLIDSTTGKYIPLALDPFYFLRVSETLVANNGVLPEFDKMRGAGLINAEWHKEILPQSTILIWNIIKIFNPNTTLRFADVLNPVIFFALGLIVFFFLTWKLSNSKLVALASITILTVIPPYLYRTLAGFSDHEAIGMFGFFLALLSFSFGLIYLDKKKTTYLKSSLFGLVSGFFTIFAVATWSGGAKFLFMILPLAFFVMWFLNRDKSRYDYILFYSMWIVGILASTLFYRYEMIEIIKAYMLGSTGILTLFALGYIIIETILPKFVKLSGKLRKYFGMISFVLTIVLGLLIYQLFIGNALDLFSNLILKILNPFSGSRLATTVAEQKQPYLNDWIGQIGKFVFYTFLAGCFMVGGKLAQGIKEQKNKLIFVGSFVFFVMGILFSRISYSSAFNGSNFISKALFFISFLALAISSIYIYKKSSDWKIDSRWIIIASWMIPMLLAVRSAIRVFFMIVPFVSFMIPLMLFEIGEWAKKRKDNFMKWASILVLGILIIWIAITSFGFYKVVNSQAKGQIPSYNQDWQKAMKWVRENTSEDSVFVHWWDYGYWIQTGGQRATVADGGHVQGKFNGNHKIGRYVLTTPNPGSAKSFMKSLSVDYLLIDPTDIGKYSAYSSIGTGKDVDDRTSYLATLVSNPKDTQETKNGIIRVYQGGIGIDGDIIYKEKNNNVFLPRGLAGLGAIIIEKNGSEYTQPIGVYIYNNKRHRLPLRYLFVRGKLFDFKRGVNSTAYVYANVHNSGSGQQVDPEGAVMYLSAKTKDSLVAKLYLMDDPDKEYKELELVHSESPYPFPFYYGGFRGPIKIWKVGEMKDIVTYKEFYNRYGDFADMDGKRWRK